MLHILQHTTLVVWTRCCGFCYYCLDPISLNTTPTGKHCSCPASFQSLPSPFQQLHADPAGGRPSTADTNAARREVMHTLAKHFLPLVPFLPHPKECVMTLLACAKTEYGWAGGSGEAPLAEVLLRRLGQDDCALLRQADAQSHALLWWSLSEAPNDQLVAAQGQLLAASAECLVGMEAGAMVPQNCSNVLLACARLRHYPTHVPLVHHLTRCLAELPNAKPQELANGLYALGELHEDCGHVPHQEDLDQLVGAVIRRLQCGREAGEATGGFTDQGISNMLLGCAKLGVEDGEAVQLLAAAAGETAGRMNSQDNANNLWALGKLLGAGGVAAIGLATPDATGGSACTATALSITPLLQEVRQRLSKGQQQQRFSPPGPKRLAVVAAHMAAPAFTSQHLSNMLYGMALLQPYIDAAVQSGHAGANTADTCLTAAAKALAEECRRRSFQGFERQELANAAWALAKMGHADQDWFAAAVAAAQRPAFAAAALPMHWAQLWYALALVRHHPPPQLMACTAAAVEGQVRRAAPQGCAVLLWSFAVLNVWEERLAGLLLGRLAELVERQQQGQGQAGVTCGDESAGSNSPRLVEQNLANALWAVAVAGPSALAADAREVGMLLREAARRWEQGGGRRAGEASGQFTKEALQQLWQVQLELKAIEGGGSSDGGRRTAAALSSILPAAGAGSLLAAAELAAQEERMLNESISNLQRGVVAASRRLQKRQQETREPSGSHGRSRSLAPIITSVQLEAPVPALNSRVDVLVELSDGQRKVLEVDGPVHYMGNSPYEHTKDGPTELRDRQLARVFGQANVVCVPYWKWDALQGDQAAEEAYVWGLLVRVEGLNGEEAGAGKGVVPLPAAQLQGGGVAAAAAGGGAIASAPQGEQTGGGATLRRRKRSVEGTAAGGDGVPEGQPSQVCGVPMRTLKTRRSGHGSGGIPYALATRRGMARWSLLGGSCL